jgi:hypothetical protein
LSNEIKVPVLCFWALSWAGSQQWKKQFKGDETLYKNDASAFQKNTPDVQLDHPGYEINFRRRPTLPLSFPSSTIGAKELNFRVRDGNGCDLFAIATEKLKVLKSHRQFVCKRRLERSDCVNYFVAKPHDRLVPVS